MLHIVTGERDAGKSRFLMAHYHSHRQGDGVVALKIVADGKVIGYDAYFIGQDRTVPLMRHHDALPDNFPKTQNIGPFYYDPTTFMIMNAYIIDLIQKKISPIYIDEIGRLEMAGQGLDRAMQYGFRPEGDVYMVIRDEFLHRVINHYRLQPVEIIDVGARHYV